MAETLWVKIRAVDEFSGTFNRLSGSASGMSAKMAMAGAAAAVGIGLLAKGLWECTQAAMESEKITAETGAILETTGGVANVTAGEIDRLSNAIRNKTGYDDEQIQSAANMMLTFKKVRNEAGAGNDIFNQSIELSADLARKFGTDVPTAAKQLGKALEDPIAGVTALRRMGVQLSDQQKQQVKDFMAAGDVMSAQKIILGEVESQVGKVAEAYGKTLAGKLDILKSKFGDIKETIGAALIPIVGELATSFSGTIDKIMPSIEKFGKALGPVISELAKPIAEGMTTGIEALASALNLIMPILPGVIGFLGDLNDILMNMNPVVFAKNLYDWMKPDERTFKNATDAFADFYKNLAIQQKQGGGYLVDNWKLEMMRLTDQIVAARPIAADKQRKLMDELLKVIETYGPDFQDATDKLIKTMAREISAKTGVPVTEVEKLLRQMRGKVSKTNLGPETSMIMGSIRDGIANSQTSINAAMAQIGHAMAAGLGSTRGEILARMEETLDAIGAAAAGKSVSVHIGTRYSTDQVSQTIAGIQAYVNSNPVYTKVNLTFHGGGLVMHGGGKVDSGKSKYHASTGSGEVPALLERGEFVVNKRATKKNIHTLQAINSGKSVGGTVVNFNSTFSMASDSEMRRAARKLSQYLAAEGAR